MEDFLIRTWNHLVGRLDGPLWLRIVLQPVLASIIGLLIGIKDARAGRASFVWTLLTDRLHRCERLREAWGDMARMFVAATVIDVIYQIVVLHWIYPLQSLLVATTLALVPYALVRVATHYVISFWLYRDTRRTSSAVSRKSA